MAESVEVIQCACVRNGPPLWGYCADDLFCPLCGDRITQLNSTQDLSDPSSPLLIYKQADSGYSFPLSLDYGGQDRTRKTRVARIDSEKSSLAPQTYFSTRLGVPPVAKAGIKFYCWLIPRNDLDSSHLPSRGLDSEVTLVGDFGRMQFPVLICNYPEIVVELTGRGVDYDKDMNWKVWRDEKLELEFRLRATNATVIIEEETEIMVDDSDALSKGLAPVTAVLRERLRKGAKLLPEEGDQPAEEWSSPLTLDARSFGKPGRKCQLIFPIDLLGIDAEEPLVLNLTYVDSGRLEFSPATLTIDKAYLGDVRSNAKLENPEPIPPIPKWYISNGGQQDITVRISGPDELAADGNEKAQSWLQVQWAAPADTDEESVKPDAEGLVTLRPNEQAQLYVKIDLTGFDKNTFEDGTPLSETIVLKDDRDMPWRARVELNHVVHRSSEASTTVAIDFGNTHSFAAMWHPGDMPREFDHDEIVPVHDLRRPDSFPTAIYFENVSNEKDPVYYIGHEAMARAAVKPDGLVTDLKRWIGRGEVKHVRNIIDRHENKAKYDIETLAVMFLRALILQSENVVRKYEIRKLGISYPSKFGPERRRAFDRILAKLAEGSPHLPPVELVMGGAAIDEANAAVISCVLSSEFQKQHRGLLKRGRFTVAAVDWGGGSLDTALLDFQVRGQAANPIFTSQYLAIGGDEFFGGDNMTVSVMEMLIDTLSQILKEVVPLDAWERLVHLPAEKGTANLTQLRNFALLWAAAEKVKQFQSNHLKTEAPSSTAVEKLREELTELLVDKFKYRLPSRPDANNPTRPDEDLNQKACETVAEAIRLDQFLINLDEAWTRDIRADFEGDGSYSTKDRFREHLERLMESAARSESKTGETPLDVLVLCGSASRLPLVEDLVREVCPGVELINDPADAKRRVAYGIVRYVDAHWNDHKLARSSDYTNAAFGLVRGGARYFIQVIPECSPVLKPELCYPFLQHGETEAEPIELAPFMQKDNKGKKLRLDLYREGSHRQGVYGHFDLSSPPTGSEERPAALDSGLPITGYLRLNGSESKIELFLEIDSVTYGPWPLIPKVNDN